MNELYEDKTFHNTPQKNRTRKISFIFIIKNFCKINNVHFFHKKGLNLVLNNSHNQVWMGWNHFWTQIFILVQLNFCQVDMHLIFELDFYCLCSLQNSIFQKSSADQYCIKMKMLLQKWLYSIYVSTTSSSEAKTNFWITQDAIKGRNRREHRCEPGHT